MIKFIRGRKRLSIIVETLLVFITCLVVPEVLLPGIPILGFIVSFLISCVLSQVITGESLLWSSEKDSDI